MLSISIFVLEITNINYKTMKKNRILLLITVFLSLSILGGYLALGNKANIFIGLNLVITILIIGIGAIALIRAFKDDKEEKEGLSTEDELSMRIKYKSGYYAYLASMYMWLFVFLLKDKFPDTETMLGGGILLSALISCMAKYVVKHKFNE